MVNGEKFGLGSIKGDQPLLTLFNNSENIIFKEGGHYNFIK